MRLHTALLVVDDDTASTPPRALSAPRKTHARSYVGYSDGLLTEGKEATLRDRGDDSHLLQSQIGTGNPTVLVSMCPGVLF